MSAVSTRRIKRAGSLVAALMLAGTSLVVAPGAQAQGQREKQTWQDYRDDHIAKYTNPDEKTCFAMRPMAFRREPRDVDPKCYLVQTTEERVRKYVFAQDTFDPGNSVDYGGGDVAKIKEQIRREVTDAFIAGADQCHFFVGKKPIKTSFDEQLPHACDGYLNKSRPAPDPSPSGNRGLLASFFGSSGLSG
ncbi:hypothetical protein ACFSSC_09425 [Corynebacterium mendelii]|uniref:DUF3558 domain-containing protein n=1 Tax=Corynebacterium mendelii TaxID=2765362 RepID=A0A939E3Q3_9CORY|nr:hypothetical protein [Corynebacterium mendelii]MBN9645198.1 hypothetical protein [Corynebacterium mendelii]